MKEQDYAFSKIYLASKVGAKSLDGINDEDKADDLEFADSLTLDMNNKEDQIIDNCIDINPQVKDSHSDQESDVVIKLTNELIENNMEGTIIMATPTCSTGLNPNCGECCAIFTDAAKRTAFGYQLETAACECHDICVEDVRDICVKIRTLRHCVPCTTDGSAGCRGGFLPDGPPTVQNVRILCAEERLSPATGCDRITNEIEFEVVLRFGNTLVVVTPRDTFDCFWFEFAKFPSGVFYTNDQTGLNQFRTELAVIDGSCKVIIIENVRVVTDGNDCILVIDYKVVDKLWKHENLLVSAIKPYADNITVKQEFAQGHKIAPCVGSGPCGGI